MRALRGGSCTSSDHQAVKAVLRGTQHAQHKRKQAPHAHCTGAGLLPVRLSSCDWKQALRGNQAGPCTPGQASHAPLRWTVGSSHLASTVLCDCPRSWRAPDPQATARNPHSPNAPATNQGKHQDIKTYRKPKFKTFRSIQMKT